MDGGFIADTARFSRKPVYVVLFSPSSDLADGPQHIVAAGQAAEDITVPHGLDRAVAAVLPGLWYCLHLPNDLAELVDTPARILKRAQGQHLDHEILLAPMRLFNPDVMGGWLEFAYPVLAVCPDDLAQQASERADALGFLLPVAKFSEFSSSSLRSHWKAIHSKLMPELPYLGREPELSSRLDLAATQLPKVWLARQMDFKLAGIQEMADDQQRLVGEALHNQVILAAIARLEDQNATPSVAQAKMSQMVAEERDRARFPVALALPGVATGYSRRAYTPTARERIGSIVPIDSADVWSVDMTDKTDTLIERSAIEFITAHRAVARSGIGIMLPEVPQQAFNILAQLEGHFRANAKGPQVWQMLGKLNEAMEPVWNEVTAAAISRSSMLTAFTNFPIGLLRLPGDTQSLSTRIPIAYRPILPLTNAVQRELNASPTYEVPADFSVTVAECIPGSDPVGVYSRRGWERTENFIRSTHPEIRFRRFETMSKAALRAAVGETWPDFLVISAHGRLSREANMAGLAIGTEFSMGTDLGPMPPVVILSACSVAPRGTSAVSITDLLLRQDALAVLGAQVPVDVFHNALLMGRFFLYIRESVNRREPHVNLLEVWHRTQTTNAVNDILNGSESLRTWGEGRAANGKPILEEFMLARASGRLRNVYSDCEEILGEIADGLGMGDKVRNWFRRPGYVPESLFYLFAGSPERIYLRPADEILRRGREI